VDPRKHALGKMKFIELLISTEDNEGEGVYLTIITYSTQL
jgi:hypothetical protein